MGALDLLPSPRAALLFFPLLFEEFLSPRFVIP